ncbi:MAG: hypothetical protein V5A43_05675 [Haloarculaceae archaeon]
MRRSLLGPLVRLAPARWPNTLTRVQEWLLLTGNRLLVSAAVLLVVAAVVLGLVFSGLAPLVRSTPIEFLVFALISGNFVLISIVISLNQFVLSRHLESPDEIRSRMDEMLGYRREVSATSRREVLPITQAGFLIVLFHTLGRQVRDLERAIPETTDEAAQEELLALSGALEGHCRSVLDRLERGTRGVQAALFEMLNESYASFIYLTYHLESEHAAGLAPDTEDLLADVNRSLEQLDVARRLFKTVFIQSELASLSRMLLYIGLPVQLLSVLLMLAFTAPAGSEPATSVLQIVVPAIVVFGFAPIVILAAYIVRLSTVAERTAAMYPFTSEPSGIADLPDTHYGVEVDREAGGAGASGGGDRYEAQ